MGETIEKRLADLGVTLPAAASPAANYVPFMLTGSYVFTAGQLPLKDGKLLASGLVGRDVDTAAAKVPPVNARAGGRTVFSYKGIIEAGEGSERAGDTCRLRVACNVGVSAAIECNTPYDVCTASSDKHAVGSGIACGNQSHQESIRCPSAEGGRIHAGEVHGRVG